MCKLHVTLSPPCKGAHAPPLCQCIAGQKREGKDQEQHWLLWVGAGDGPGCRSSWGNSSGREIMDCLEALGKAEVPWAELSPDPALLQPSSRSSPGMLQVFLALEKAGTEDIPRQAGLGWAFGKATAVRERAWLCGASEARTGSSATPSALLCWDHPAFSCFSSVDFMFYEQKFEF